LERAVKSALNQDLPFHEIVIVDDGMNASPFIPGTRMIRTDGLLGLPRARNIGLGAASLADAYCYLDDDDELLPNYTTVQSALIESGCEYAFSIAKYRYADGSETTDPEPSNTGPKRYYDPEALLSQNIAPVSSFVHTRRALDEVGKWGEDILKIEDWDFWGRMFIAFGPPGKSEEVTNLIHRDGGPTMSTGTFSYAAACSWRDVVEERLRYLSAEGRCRMTEEEEARFAVPKAGMVAVTGDDALLPMDVAGVASLDPEFEITVMAENPQSIAPLVPGARIFQRDTGSSNTSAANNGLLRSRSAYIGVAMKEMVNPGEAIKILDEDRTSFLAGFSGGFLMRRRVLEVAGGLDEGMSLEDALPDFWIRMASKFSLKTV
jgi:hypothetical protein